MKIVNENFVRFDELYYGDVFRYKGQYYLCAERLKSDGMHSETVGVNLEDASVEYFEGGGKVEIVNDATLVIGKEHKE